MIQGLKVENNKVFFGNSFIKREDLIELLSQQIQPNRLSRIEQVVSQRTDEVYPVVEHIYDRGNINAVMRSAEAFGFYNFHIINSPSGQFKVANRVSQGADKWLDTIKHKDTKSLISSFKNQNIKIYATSLKAKKTIDELDFSKPCAIIFGNEKDGVTDDLLDRSDENFILPMSGFSQSFNISVAASLCFYHIHQWRKQHCKDKAFVDPDKALWLKLDYIIRSCGGAERVEIFCTHHLKKTLNER